MARWLNPKQATSMCMRRVALVMASASLIAGCGGQPTEDEELLPTNPPSPTTPTLGVNSPSAVEGSALSFIVGMTPVSENEVTFSYTTQAFTADASDFTAASGVATIPAGQSFVNIPVSTSDDALNESSEAVKLVISSPTGGAVIGVAEGLGTITDNDPEPTIFISDAGTISEGQSAAFLVQISAVSGRNVSFVYSTVNGSATAGSDFVARSGTGVITAGQTSITLNVITIDDLSHEPSESFSVSVSTATGATVSVGSASAVLADNDNAPSLFVASSSSGSEGGVLPFVVSLSAASGYEVSFDYALVSGSAQASLDYVNQSGVASFPVGSAAITIAVALVDDSIYEGTETLSLSTSNPVNAVLAQGVGSGSILDNDPAPAIYVGDVNLVEGGTAQFVVSLSAPSSLETTLNLATTDGTAVSPGDYLSLAGMFTIPALSSAITIPVVTVEDALSEGIENFTLNASSPVNATLGDGVGTASINDNDNVPSFFIFDASSVEGGTALVVVSLSETSAQDVTFNYVSIDDSALAGADYSAASGSGVITAGSLTAEIAVLLIDDLNDEPTEYFLLSLSSIANANAIDNVAQVGITDNDVAPSISVYDAITTEGGTLGFVVSLSAPSGFEVSFDFQTLDGTAVAPTDYLTSSGAMTFPIMTGALTVAISTIDDSVYESDESMVVSLSSFNNATPGDVVAHGLITDNEPTPQIYVGDASVAEGSTLVFLVSLDTVHSLDVTFTLSTLDGTATGASDYQSSSAVYTIAAGNFSLGVPVVTVDDTTAEPNETMSVTLSGLSGASLGDGLGSGTILDNDPDPTIYVADASSLEGSALSFLVSLSEVSGKVITFQAQTYDGTATAASGDYTTLNQTFSIAAGTASALINVSTGNDFNPEADETFLVSLSNLFNAQAGDLAATGTITNDDVVPDIYVIGATVTEGGTLQFTVSISEVTGPNVTFSYATANGTAIAGQDFTGQSGTGTISFGNLTFTVLVPTTQDLFYENDETMTFEITGITNANAVVTQDSGTILSDDAMPNLFISDVVVTEGQSAQVVLSLSQASGLDTTGHLDSLNQTAFAGSDYQAWSGPFTISAGQDQLVIGLSLIDDAIYELTETFLVSISAVGGANLVDSVGVVQIDDNDPAPSLSIYDASVEEGGTLEFVVSLTGATYENVTFSYGTVNGTALSGSDYVALSGSATIVSPALAITLAVATIEDVNVEADEDLLVTLTSLIGASAADLSASGIILNDDLPVPEVYVSALAASVTEGETAQFVVSLSNIASGDVTFTGSGVGGTASSGSDFVALSQLFTIPQGSLSLIIPVTTIDDETTEVTENFSLSLSGATGGNISISSASVSLLDNDICSRVTLEDYQQGAGKAATSYSVGVFGLTIMTSGVSSTNNQAWTTRLTNDGGTSWSAPDLYLGLNNQPAQANGVQRAPNGAWHVVGFAGLREQGTVYTKWQTRLSTNGGSTWALGDDYILATKKSAQANALHVRSGGAITLYAVGSAIDATDFTHWIVRTSATGGSGAWSTSDDFQLSANQAAQAYAVSSDSIGNVYVVGSASNGTSTRWVVRKHNGTSWSTVANWEYAANRNAEARAIAIDSANGIYVGGWAHDGTSNRWIVRYSSNGGSSWTTVDDYQLVSGQSAQANGITLNSSGHIYVVGQAGQSTGGTRWIVRRSQNAGASWENVDSYQYTAGFNANAQAIVVDGSGDFIVTGGAADATASRWISRKVICQ